MNMVYNDKYVVDEDYLIDQLQRKYGSSYSKKSYFPILISCVDNNSTRKLLGKVFHSDKIKELIYIDSGNGTVDMIGQTVVGFKKQVKDEEFKKQHGYYGSDIGEIIAPCAADVFPEINSEVATIEDVLSCGVAVDKNPQNIGTNFMAATAIFTIVNKLLGLGKFEPTISYFDAEELEIVTRENKLKGN